MRFLCIQGSLCQLRSPMWFFSRFWLIFQFFPNIAALSLKACCLFLFSSSSLFFSSCSIRISSSNLLVLRIAAIYTQVRNGLNFSNMESVLRQNLYLCLEEVLGASDTDLVNVDLELKIHEYHLSNCVQIPVKGVPKVKIHLSKNNFDLSLTCLARTDSPESSLSSPAAAFLKMRRNSRKLMWPSESSSTSWNWGIKTIKSGQISPYFFLILPLSFLSVPSGSAEPRASPSWPWAPPSWASRSRWHCTWNGNAYEWMSFQVSKKVI